MSALSNARTDRSPLAAPTWGLAEGTAASPIRPNAFFDLLSNGLSAVNSAQHQADEQVHNLLTGGDVTHAEVLTSVQKADMAFRLLIQVRNKLMSAYEELNAIRV